MYKAQLVIVCQSFFFNFLVFSFFFFCRIADSDYDRIADSDSDCDGCSEW